MNGKVSFMIHNILRRYCHIHGGLCTGCLQAVFFVLCFFCAGCEWQVLLHRCCSSESNQLTYGVETQREKTMKNHTPYQSVAVMHTIKLFANRHKKNRRRRTQREASARFLTWRDHPSLKEVVEPFWSPFSLVSCSEEFGNSSLLSASNSKPSFSGAT
ncbi:hypothetical protein ILYODFUR_002131 [Ilyodon furcidens]|uniref:Secreted protein n=1 Tax=Ilyodon furcidens TaxID=33524 RepID=A0ABV0TGT3_9TELE